MVVWSYLIRLLSAAKTIEFEGIRLAAVKRAVPNVHVVRFNDWSGNRCGDCKYHHAVEHDEIRHGRLSEETGSDQIHPCFALVHKRLAGCGFQLGSQSFRFLAFHQRFLEQPLLLFFFLRLLLCSMASLPYSHRLNRCMDVFRSRCSITAMPSKLMRNGRTSSFLKVLYVDPGG